MLIDFQQIEWGMPNPSCKSALRTKLVSGIDRVDEREVMRQTKHMIACDKNLRYYQVSVTQTLSNAPLGYSQQEKEDLETLINDNFFKEVNANSDPGDLKELTTVADLYLRIFEEYIPEQHRIE